MEACEKYLEHHDLSEGDYGYKFLRFWHGAFLVAGRKTQMSKMISLGESFKSHATGSSFKGAFLAHARRVINYTFTTQTRSP